VRYEIRQLHVGEILDQAIALTRRQFKPLFWITIALFTPATIINGVVATHLSSLIDPEQFEAAPPVLDEHFWITLAAALLFMLLYWTIAYPLLLTGLIANSAILVGTMCCWIPGIYLALIFSLSSQIVVIEGIWQVSALQRSFQLTKDSILIGMVLGQLLIAINGAMVLGAAFIPMPQVASIVSSLVSSCSFVFSTAAWVIYYFSCRCKTENFDLALLVDAVARD
jgi:hypothetical protein